MALADCLKSLARQIVQPCEYLIIDNDSTDQTKKVVTDFAQLINQKFSAKVQVGWRLESRLGFPVVYNRGLNEAKSDWVIFIDDDCVADPKWLASYLTEINQPKVTENFQAFVGKSETLLPATIWSLAVLAMDQFWKLPVITSSNQVLDLETLDNKNVAYYKPFLKLHRIKFNESAMLEPGRGAAEDADLGMQLAVAGAKAKYLPAALIRHRDPNQLVWFFNRLKFGAVANFYYASRWQKTRQKMGLIELRNTTKFRKFWPKFCVDQNLFGLRSWLVLGIISLSFWLINNWQKNWKNKYAIL